MPRLTINQVNKAIENGVFDSSNTISEKIGSSIVDNKDELKNLETKEKENNSQSLSKNQKIIQWSVTTLVCTIVFSIISLVIASTIWLIKTLL